MNTSTDKLIGKGMIFPLPLNSQGTLQLTGGFDLLKASLNNFLAWVIGDRYFLGEFGGSPEDQLENPNSTVTQALIKHRIESQLPLWDKRLKIDMLDIQSDNFTTMTIILKVSLNGTDLSEIIEFPVTVNNVQ